ncbi:hypothetical protein C0989_001993 [Termitomyces sp. Mn162]|nr:hypothetical protein C0989_001993 [Termitomyces sp. Mn162]
MDAHSQVYHAAYINSNPSSTHSSPRSYARELDLPYQPYPQSHIYQNAHRLPPMKSASCGPLHVSTNTPHDSDPNERTARPGNAYRHHLFHAQTMPLPQLNNVPMHEDPLGRNTNLLLESNYTSSTPGLSAGLTRPLKSSEQERLAQLDKLKFFLATAPSSWDTAGDGDQPNNATSLNGQSLPNSYPSLPSSNGLGMHHGGPDGQSQSHPPLNRFLLPSGEHVSCVLWNGLYHITGTDIVRALVFRFEAFGRPVRNMKKFEEGVFSDLRNLKPGVDACLEEPKSQFLDLLFKFQCIRTQKKQKVFYWFSVPHDRLFLDALERDLKREKMGQEPTTVIVGEPAMSFTYDPKKSLYEQFSKAQGVRDGEGELETALRIFEESSRMNPSVPGEEQRNGDVSTAEESDTSVSDADEMMADVERRNPPALQTIGLGSSWLGGASTYKVRRKGAHKDEKRGRNILGDAHRKYENLSHSRERDNAFLGDQSVSAADMFYLQADGELPAADGHRKPNVGPYYSAPAGQPQLQGTRLSTTGTGHQRTRSQDRYHRHTVPLVAPPATTASTLTTGYTPSLAQQQDAHDGASMTKTKAFACPLFSCGRMFKRMEHLKRHLRTHTMERPYACPQCNKKFSRSDNLNQHLRTHGRGHSGAIGATTAPGLVDQWIETSGDEADESSGGSPDGRSTSVGKDHEAGVESDYDEGLGMFGTGMGMGLTDFNGSMFGGSSGLYGTDIDPRSCEVEVPGDLPDMSSDEDGIMGFGQEVYYPAHNNLESNGQHQQNGFNASWALRPQPSPAFSNVSAPSSPPGTLGHVRSNSSRSSVPYHRTHSSTSSASGSSVYGGDDYVTTSLSAPSHKQAFDHSAFYPSGLLEAAGSGPGPTRRHRSMTPSAMRTAESIRRPGTASSTSGDSPRSSAGLNIGGRGYHPYAAYGGPSSRPASTHSSPSTFPITLAGEYPNHPGMRRSESRNSNLGGTMMTQMMNMSMESSSSPNSGNGQQQQTGFQRKESPFLTASPAAFTSELPPVTTPFGAGAGVFGLEGGSMQDQSGFMQGIEDSSSYFSHSQHATL